jgi:hypothetical protein
VSGDPELVKVAEAPNGVAGSILAGALESAGIPVLVRGGHAGWLYPGAVGGLGPVDLLVPARFVADAQAILAGLDAGD